MAYGIPEDLRKDIESLPEQLIAIQQGAIRKNFTPAALEEAARKNRQLLDSLTRRIHNAMYESYLQGKENREFEPGIAWRIA